MSIITDALKKAQKDRSAVDGPLEPYIEITESRPEIKRRPSNMVTIYIFLGVVLLVGISVLYAKNKKAFMAECPKITSGLRGQSEPLIMPESKKPEQVAASMPVMPAITPANEMRAPEIPDEIAPQKFKLTGIVYDPINSRKSFALINGDVFSAGDPIGDAKLLKINKDSVSLMVDSEELTLKIPR